MMRLSDLTSRASSSFLWRRRSSSSSSPRCISLSAALTDDIILTNKHCWVLVFSFCWWLTDEEENPPAPRIVKWGRWVAQKNVYLWWARPNINLYGYPRIVRWEKMIGYPQVRCHAQLNLKQEGRMGGYSERDFNYRLIQTQVQRYYWIVRFNRLTVTPQHSSSLNIETCISKCRSYNPVICRVNSSFLYLNTS